MSLSDIDNALTSGKSLFNKDSEPGEEYTADIIDAELKQASDPETGDPAIFKSGDPKMQIVVRVQLTADEIRVLYFKTWGKQRDRLNEAINRAGAKKASEVFRPGVKIRAKYLGEKRGEGGPSGSYRYKDYEYEFIRGAAIDTALDLATSAFGSDATPVASAPAAGPDLNTVPEGVPAERWAAMDEGQKLGYLKAIGKA